MVYTNLKNTPSPKKEKEIFSCRTRRRESQDDLGSEWSQTKRRFDDSV